MIEISQALDRACPHAEYYGSLVNNTKAEYDKLMWLDARQKPTWDALQPFVLEIAKEIKLNEIKEAWENQLLLGYTTSFGITADTTKDSINNWTTALKLIDLLPDKITITFNIIQSSYPDLPYYVVYQIICAQFFESYPNEPQICSGIKTEWTLIEYITYMLDNFNMSITDFYNNPPHILSIQQYKMFCLEVGNYYQSLFNKKWVLRQDVEAATTLQEVQAVNWNA